MSRTEGEIEQGADRGVYKLRLQVGYIFCSWFWWFGQRDESVRKGKEGWESVGACGNEVDTWIPCGLRANLP